MSPVPIDAEPLDAFVATISDHSISTIALANALSHDQDLLDSRIVVRDQTIGIFGDWSPRLRYRLQALRVQLTEQLPYVSHVSFDEVKAACSRIAERLVGRVNARTVVVPVPRGGLIVAGLLAYELNIPRDRVRLPRPGEEALVVDDVSISGVRLAEVLHNISDNSTTVALLACTEGASQFLHTQPGHSLTIVADRTLLDHAERVHGDGSNEWRGRWQKRQAEGAVVITDHLVFPWSEPDWTFWNEATQDEDRGFRLHCECGTQPHERVMTIDGNFPGTFDDTVWFTYGQNLLVAREQPDRTISFLLDDDKATIFQMIASSSETTSFSGRFITELRAQLLVR